MRRTFNAACLLVLGLALILSALPLTLAQTARTRIIDTVTDSGGNPRRGRVTFILTQVTTTPAGIAPASASVSATLDQNGRFDISVYPSTSLSPQAYYQVWFADANNLNRELLGVYEVPTSATPITLAGYRVTDTNLATRYTFASTADADRIVQAVSAATLQSLSTNLTANNLTANTLTVTGAMSAASAAVSGNATVGGNQTVSGTLTAGAVVGNGAGLTGLTGATGGVANTGSTTIGADTDSDDVGIIDLQTQNETRLRVENDGATTFFGNIRLSSDNTINFGSLAAKPHEMFTRTLIIGDVLAGHQASLSVFTSPGNEGGDWVAWFSHEGNALNNEALMRLQHFSQGYVPQPIFTGLAARGTRAAPTPVQTNDYLLVLDGRGYDGSNTSWSEYAPGWSDTSAQIAFRATQNWSGTTHGSEILFRVTPNGSTTPVARAYVRQNGFEVEGQFIVSGGGAHINTPGPGNNDIAGVLTISSDTSATKTFAAPYGSTPVCTLTPVQDMGATRWWVETTTTYVRARVSTVGSFQFYYTCFGNPS